MPKLGLSLAVVKRHRSIFILFLVFLLLGLALIPSYRYQLNADATSYITIAQKYANGDLRQAINGYWGPLMSWLAVPFLWLNIDPLVAMKLVQVLIACGMAMVTYLILRTLNFRPWLVVFGAAISGVVSLDWGLSGELTPDLLSSLLILIILYLFLRSKLGELTMVTQVLVGTAGALLYWSKSIGFFLFLGFWAIWTLVEWLNKSSLKNLIQTSRAHLLSLGVFIALILPFVLLISLKYDKPTIGTSGAYNFALSGPKSSGHPMLYQLLPPPNNTATSIWEDISLVPINSWRPLDSAQDFGFFAALLRKNVSAGYQILMAKAAAVIVLALIYLFFVKRKQIENYFSVTAAGFSLLVFLAYIPLFVELRYLLPIIFIAILGYVGFAEKWASLNQKLLSLVIFAIGSAFMVWPLWHLNNNLGMNKNIYLDSLTLKPYLNSSVNVAGDDFVATYACFYTNSHCYSVIDLSAKDIPAQLTSYNIDYLILGPGTAENLTSKGIELKLVPNAHYLGRNLYQFHK